MSLFEETVDEHIAERIVYWMGGPYFALRLRETSRRCAQLIGAPPRVSDPRDVARIALMIGDSEKCKKVITRDVDNMTLLNYVVRIAATYDRRDILEVMFDEIGDDQFMFETCAMYVAASNGNRELCKFILKHLINNADWKCMHPEIRTDPFARMMMGATYSGRCDLFKLAWKWSEKYANAVPNLNEPIRHAARGGRIEMCKLARGWVLESGQSIDVEGMLCSAAEGNSVNACKLAREWGARGYERTLEYAARSGDIGMCKIAREWLEDAGPYDARVFRNMLINAAVAQRFETLRLAYDWWIAKLGRNLDLDEIDDIVRYVMFSGDAKVCEFLHQTIISGRQDDEETRERMTAIIDKIMIQAALYGNVELCILIHSWGAQNYEMYLTVTRAEDPHLDARSSAPRKTCEKLIEKWMAERNDA